MSQTPIEQTPAQRRFLEQRRVIEQRNRSNRAQSRTLDVDPSAVLPTAHLNSVQNAFTHPVVQRWADPGRQLYDPYDQADIDPSAPDVMVPEMVQVVGWADEQRTMPMLLQASMGNIQSPTATVIEARLLGPDDDGQLWTALQRDEDSWAVNRGLRPRALAHTDANGPRELNDYDPNKGFAKHPMFDAVQRDHDPTWLKTEPVPAMDRSELATQQIEQLMERNLRRGREMAKESTWAPGAMFTADMLARRSERILQEDGAVHNRNTYRGPLANGAGSPLPGDAARDRTADISGLNVTSQRSKPAPRRTIGSAGRTPEGALDAETVESTREQVLKMDISQRLGGRTERTPEGALDTESVDRTREQVSRMDVSQGRATNIASRLGRLHEVVRKEPEAARGDADGASWQAVLDGYAKAAGIPGRGAQQPRSVGDRAKAVEDPWLAGAKETARQMSQDRELD